MALLILGLILFVVLVIVHELGHFIAARRGGVEVEEFGLGFPPKIWSKKLKNKTLLTINALPLGGFVRLKGEHDADNTPGSYGAASLKTKIKIMTAGVVMNLAAALLLLTVLAWIGMPQIVPNQFSVKSNENVVTQKVLVASVEEGSPAAKADVQKLDQIITIRGASCNAEDCLHHVNSVDDVQAATSSIAGKDLESAAVVTVVRDDETFEVTANLRTSKEVEASRKTDNPKGYLGVVPSEYSVKRYTWSAPIVALGTAAQFTQLTLQGLGSALSGLFTGHASQAADQVSGPVGIFVVIRDGALLGYQFILMIIAVISLTLAIMNILPIPALDGGRLFVTLFYKATKRPLTKETEEKIHGIGFVALMLLFVVITFVDVRRFF